MRAGACLELNQGKRLTPRRSDGRLSVGYVSSSQGEGITSTQWRHMPCDLADLERSAVGAGTPSIPGIAQPGETPCRKARQWNRL